LTEKLVIHGGSRLVGELGVAGAKNSVLKLIAASLLTDHAVEITNVPNLSDVTVMSDVVRFLGRSVEQKADRLVIQAGQVSSVEAPYDLVSKMRASFLVLGSLLGRYGHAKVSLPGGCSIGKRGVDLHVKGLTALGAEIEIHHGFVEAKASRLVGAKILLDVPSVGATENILLASVLAEGSTVISNAAQEPEISDLANFLNSMGADISGAGTHEILINGVTPEQLCGFSYCVVPDRIEAATYMMAAIGTRGDVLLKNVIPSHLDSVICKLQEMGAELQCTGPNELRINQTKGLKAQNYVTQPYPGFPTDLQAPLMTLLSTAEGVGIVTETIYENRFKHVGELNRMGANIHIEGNVAVVNGVSSLTGAPVRAHDLRAGAAMVIAGLMAQDKTEIHDIHHIDRGYDALVPKLLSLGATIERLPVGEGDMTDTESPFSQTL
jgi:UDP-N-acetylglucosamine 1-carboxyvinyltransferase